MKASALISNPGDKWRKILIKRLNLPDTASDALLMSAAALRSKRGGSTASTGGKDDPFRAALCALLRLPLDVESKVLLRAAKDRIEESEHDAHGSAPSRAGDLFHHLDLNSAAEDVRKLLGISRDRWNRFA